MPEQVTQHDLALWVIRLSSDDAEELKIAQQEFALWKIEHTELAQQIEQMMQFSEDMQQFSTRHFIRAETVHQSLSVRQKSTRQMKKIWGSVFTLGLLVVAGYWGIQSEAYQIYHADMKSAVGQQQRYQLEDGSTLTLAADSAVNLHFDQQQRKIELLKGELLVDVAKDIHRPFVVQANHADFTALGTRFIVQQDEQRSRLTLLHSKVRARLNKNHQLQQLVQQGQILDATDQGFSQIKQINPALIENALQQEQIIAEDMSLFALLQQLKRFHNVYFIYQKTDLENIQINGIIDAKQQPAQTLALIATQYPKLKIQNIADKFIVIQLS